MIETQYSLILQKIDMPKTSYIILTLTFFFLLLQTEAKKLIFVQEIFRHGARYPMLSMKNDKSQFVLTEKFAGELTSQGKHMQYILGKIMYDRYWNQLFAGTQYANKYHPSQIYVKSTNFNRTIESAQSQLQGLFQKLPLLTLPSNRRNYSLPPFLNSLNYQGAQENNATQFNVFGKIVPNFHPVPIHTDKQLEIPASDTYKFRANPYDEGDFLLKYQFNNCPNQNFWAKENMASRAAMKIKNSDQVINFLKALSHAVNTQVKYQDAYNYIDDYQCELYLGRPYLQLFNIPQYQKAAEFIMLTSTIFTFYYTQDQIKISNTRLLQNIIYRMKQAQARTGPKLVLFSAHDTTVLSLALAFKLISIECLMEAYFKGIDNQKTCINNFPQFATNLVIQLWEEDNLSHTVKVLYNGEEKSLPICNNQYSCSFTTFQSWANDFYIDDPNDACGIRQQYTILYIVIGVLSFFILVFIIIEMSKRFKKRLEKKMEEMQQKKGYLENFQEKQGHNYTQKIDN